MDFIFKFFGFLIEEFIGGIILGGLFWLVQTIGLLWIKLFRLDGRSIDKMREVYTNSALPWWLGLLTVVGVIVFLSV